jgi:hypothetical protein
MSSGANQDRPKTAMVNLAQLPSVQRGRLLHASAANDNATDWRSVWTRRVVRPLGYMASAFYGALKAMRRFWRR